MKKYRLKKEVKKYFTDEYISERPLTLSEWLDIGITIEALEEVEQRVELVLGEIQQGLDMNYYPKRIAKSDDSNFTMQEKDLCEKALNGELLDIDSLDESEFEDWSVTEEGYKICQTTGIIEILKAYLKEKK